MLIQCYSATIANVLAYLIMDIISFSRSSVVIIRSACCTPG